MTLTCTKVKQLFINMDLVTGFNSGVCVCVCVCVFTHPAQHSHFQDQGVAAGGLVGVQQADDMGVLEPLQDAQLLGHLVTLHQLLVDQLDRHGSLGAALVAPLHYRKAPPSGEEHAM